MSRTKNDSVKVRVLADCAIGSWGDVVEIDKAQLEELEARALVDSNPAAVAATEATEA